MYLPDLSQYSLWYAGQKHEYEAKGSSCHLNLAKNFSWWQGSWWGRERGTLFYLHSLKSWSSSLRSSTMSICILLSEIQKEMPKDFEMFPLRIKFTITTARLSITQWTGVGSSANPIPFTFPSIKLPFYLMPSPGNLWLDSPEERYSKAVDNVSRGLKICLKIPPSKDQLAPIPHPGN